jgi:demethylmenaquinone methyltransferase/2-methoxy-6-polyprenyl-1,4-benzoquinol methylase
MEGRELPFIRQMFDSIAPRYDLLNRLLSLRQDVAWRKAMVSAIPLCDHNTVLDVACGTGDVAVAIWRRLGPAVQVIGIDFSIGMLERAKTKMGLIPNGAVALVAGDALALPFGQAHFQAVTIAFGIRNIQDKPAALHAFYECLKPNGRMLVLELANPRRGGLGNFYLAYFRKILPRIGRLFSKHAFAYAYLPDSVARFPSADDFMALMAETGFERISCRRLTLGVANLFVGAKPG